MDLGMAGRAFAAWIGCGACILHPADRVRRRGGDPVAALSVRNALSVRRNPSPDCGWNFEQISIGALYICSEVATLSLLALVMVCYSCGGIRLPALPGPACMQQGGRKRKRPPTLPRHTTW